MATQEARDRAYMKMSYAIAELSSARRKKVGAILVAARGYGVIAEGYNGTPSGFDNNCETEEFNCLSPHAATYKPRLVTKPEVLHAESNAITKVARSTSSSHGATLYVTCAPCMECAKLIIQAGIKRVVFSETYRLADGLDLLKKAGIQVDELRLSIKDGEDLEIQNEGFIDPNEEPRHGSFA
jgi:dCMP deaminase